MTNLTFTASDGFSGLSTGRRLGHDGLCLGKITQLYRADFRRPPAGLYWYHTHPHGESYGKCSTVCPARFVIEGIESYFPALAGLPERVLVVRGVPLKTTLSLPL